MDRRPDICDQGGQFCDARIMYGTLVNVRNLVTMFDDFTV